MRSILLLVLSFVVVAAAHADTVLCARPAVYSETGLDGISLILKIPDEALRDAPGWRLGDGEPPVSIAKAVSIATAWAVANRGRFDELRVQEISLNNTACGAAAGNWYYRVSFDPMVNGKLDDTEAHFIAILMDGKVVEPHKASHGS